MIEVRATIIIMAENDAAADGVFRHLSLATEDDDVVAVHVHETSRESVR